MQTIGVCPQRILKEIQDIRDELENLIDNIPENLQERIVYNDIELLDLIKALPHCVQVRK